MGFNALKNIKIGVIPAAGIGSRINDLLLTRVLPKPMLPILNKPLLQYSLENMKRLGVKDVFLIVGHKKEIIQEYFGNGEDFGLHITYIDQFPPKGIAQAISLTEDYISEEFAVILGDDLTVASSLNNLIDTFGTKHALVVEGTVPENNLEVLKRTCSLTIGNDKQINKIVEKPVAPKPSLRGIGIYLFDHQVYDFIKLTPVSKKRGETEITDTIGLIAKQGRAYSAIIDGTNINVNTFSDLMNATKLLLDINTLNKSLLKGT